MRAFQLHSAAEGALRTQSADALSHAHATRPPNGLDGRNALFHHPAGIRAVTEGREGKAAKHHF